MKGLRFSFNHLPTRENDLLILEGKETRLEYIQERLHRLRLNLILHSIIYYELNDNLVSDDTWTNWAQELKVIQNHYPEISEQLGFHDEHFENWEGVTGFRLSRLPYLNKAKGLLSIFSG